MRAVRPADEIDARIAVVRGVRVILDADLARLYGVDTRVLMQAVRRNPARFPPDFMISLSTHDVSRLKSQSVISNPLGRGGRRSLPHAFTEHGTLMAATVLNSPRAIEASLFVVRAFMRLREAVAASAELGKRVDELERKLGTHDRSIGHILDALRQLTQPQDTPRRRRIGFL